MVIVSPPALSADLINSFMLVSLSFWSPPCLLCISLSHYYISFCIIRVVVSCCPLKESFHLSFFYLNDDATLAHSHFGEGAYAIMIIIIKTILMCLVFATQLLIMAWAPCQGGEVNCCQNGQCTQATAHLSRGFRVSGGHTYLSPCPLLNWERDGTSHKTWRDESCYVEWS